MNVVVQNQRRASGASAGSERGASSANRAVAMPASDAQAPAVTGVADVGLVGLAVMGQNLALNIAEKGIPVSVYNRSQDKVAACVARASKDSLDDKLKGYGDVKTFVESLRKPRKVILLVKAGAPVDATIAALEEHLEEGDVIIDGGNEWYENTERRQQSLAEKGGGVMLMGMGVSGGEEGARNGPSMMPGGNKDAYALIEPIVKRVAAQTDDGACVTYVGPGGAGNFVKMVHNGIEYGDMQLIAETYDILKYVGGLDNQEISDTFTEWNKGELESFLIEISARIFSVRDDQADTDDFLIDKILDKTGMKGTGKWTVQQAAELSVAAPTIASSLDARFISGLKDERVAASAVYAPLGMTAPTPPASLSPEEKKQLVDDVRAALYASKICSYAQGMALIRAKSEQMGWELDLGELSRIWKGGCIIRAVFLDAIKDAFANDPALPNLLVDPSFARGVAERQEAWRRVVCMAISRGVAAPGMTASLAYFDAYRRERLPANLVQAQRDYFGSHTYQRVDDPTGEWHHSVWSESNSADSITTSGYSA